MSRSLHSSMEYFCSSKRWSRKLSDMEPEKSSMGEISSKISSSPDLSGTSPRPEDLACATRACQRSLPSSQSKLSVWRASRSGTSRGSRIFAKERRPEAVRAVDTVWVALREAAKDGPSTGLLKLKSAHAHGPGSNRPTTQQKLRQRRRVETLGSAKRQHTCTRACPSNCHRSRGSTAARRAREWRVRGPASRSSPRSGAVTCG